MRARGLGTAFLGTEAPGKSHVRWHTRRGLRGCILHPGSAAHAACAALCPSQFVQPRPLPPAPPRPQSGLCLPPQSRSSGWPPGGASPARWAAPPHRCPGAGAQTSPCAGCPGSAAGSRRELHLRVVWCGVVLVEGMGLGVGNGWWQLGGRGWVSGGTGWRGRPLGGGLAAGPPAPAGSRPPPLSVLPWRAALAGDGVVEGLVLQRWYHGTAVPSYDRASPAGSRRCVSHTDALDTTALAARMTSGRPPGARPPRSRTPAARPPSTTTSST